MKHDDHFTNNDILTDAEILKAIEDSFSRNTTIPDNQITISVEDGHVTLEGEVEWDYQRIQAKTSIENIAAIKSIANLIAIRLKYTPADIQQQIITAFQHSATLDAASITAEISGSNVILRGKVRSLAEKEDTENAACSVPGVQTVESMLEIAEPLPEDDESELAQYCSYPD